MSALWHQTESLHPAFKRFNDCLADDWFLLPHELRLQAAHAGVLKKAGVLSSAELAALQDAIEKIGHDLHGKPCPQSDAEDLHTWVESELSRRAGDAGRRIHTARSRNDQVATLLKLYLLDVASDFEHKLAKLITIACHRAKDWRELVMPMQTHGQFAAPGTAGFWSLRFATAFNRHRRGMSAFHAECRRECPLGAGAVAGSSIPIDREMQARNLGFDGPSLNALDSTSSRDECVEWLSLLSRIALTMQSFATDVLAFCQTPFRWIDYPMSFGTGSSMMPNKTNPDAMELLRGECNAIHAAHQQAILLLKGLASGYQRDLQCIKPVLRDATTMAAALIDLTTEFLTAMEFRLPNLADSLKAGSLAATLDMEALVKSGIPLRDAHHSIAKMVQSGEAVGQVGNDTIYQYATGGSPNPDETDRVIRVLLAELGQSEQS